MAAAVFLRRAGGSMGRGAWRMMISKPAQKVTVAIRAIRVVNPALMERFSQFSPIRFASTATEAFVQNIPLLNVLQSEIGHEEGYEPPRGLAQGPPKPFKLEDRPGKLQVTLRRHFGREDITLTAMFQPGIGMIGDELVEDVEDMEAPEQNAVHLTVSIAKGPQEPSVLEFGCVLQKSDLTIGHVKLDDTYSKDPTYNGPDFSQLDERLQKEFKKYLDVRGVNEELANYVLDLLEDKEQREYKRWLQSVEEFIRK